ncbi:MAG: hypothetical protein WC655_27920 [Candidatus Hydrogenedentales bacterium]|jgi:hypothetical protein
MTTTTKRPDGGELRSNADYRAGLERAAKYHDDAARDCDAIAAVNQDNDLGPDCITAAADHRIAADEIRLLKSTPANESPAPQADEDETGAWADLRASGGIFPEAYAVAQSENIMTEDQIKHMVDRFLMWKLPRDTFNPDCGISFDKKPYNTHTAHPSQHEPSGTNLFDATQADAMVRYMIEGLLLPDNILPGSENMDARFEWLQSKAIDMGYSLVPEGEHPDSPHATPAPHPPVEGLVPVYVKKWRTLIMVPPSIRDEINADIAGFQVSGHADALRYAINAFEEMCDGSNWPECAQQGEGFKAYTEACEVATGLTDELRIALEGFQKSTPGAAALASPSLTAGPVAWENTMERRLSYVEPATQHRRPLYAAPITLIEQSKEPK